MEQAPFLVAQCVFTENILKDIDEYKLLLTKVNNQNLFFLNKFSLSLSYVQKILKDKNIYYMLLKL
jgi:hypothetical protein